jgi:uncharacterized membrane protein
MIPSPSFEHSSFYLLPTQAKGPDYPENLIESIVEGYVAIGHIPKGV